MPEQAEVRDAEGNLLEWFYFSRSEKIGLPNYSNVDVGPAGIGRWVKSGDIEAKKDIVKEVMDLLSAQREEVLRTRMPGQ